MIIEGGEVREGMGSMEVRLGMGSKVFEDKWKNENLRWEMILF
jgi:hypothetical protein